MNYKLIWASLGGGNPVLFLHISSGELNNGERKSGKILDSGLGRKIQEKEERKAREKREKLKSWRKAGN